MVIEVHLIVDGEKSAIGNISVQGPTNEIMIMVAHLEIIKIRLLDRIEKHSMITTQEGKTDP